MMSDDESILQLFERANPVPDPEQLDVEPHGTRLIPGGQADRPASSAERFDTTGPASTDDRRWLLPTVAAATIVVVIGGLAALGTDSGNAPAPLDMAPVATAPGTIEPTTVEETATLSPDRVVEDATAFWEAVAAGDADTAAGYVDPATLRSGARLLFGRAGTFHAQFDWYEAVDWEFTLDECVEGSSSTAATCTGWVRNPWSDAVGESPVFAKYSVYFGDDGIRRIPAVTFDGQWVSKVYGPFRAWVEDNHPDDALVMFGYGDVTEEILELYATNTTRFVRAHQDTGRR